MAADMIPAVVASAVTIWVVVAVVIGSIHLCSYIKEEVERLVAAIERLLETPAGHGQDESLGSVLARKEAAKEE